MFRRRTTAAATPTATIPITTPTNNSTIAPSNNQDTRMANGTLVADRYRLEKTIGKGSYGKVKLALNLQSGEKVAVKFIARSSIRKPAHTIRIRREINLLGALHHTNIVGLYETLETPNDIVLVMEYVPGADLFERIVSHREQRYAEVDARVIFEQIVGAIEYCHQNRVVHRDLKPENVMVDDNGRVKLIDFGFANLYHPRGFLETNCGSPLYAAPEIVQGVKYVGPEVDVWSLGVILFAMLTGTLPFEDEQLKGLYAKICAGNFIAPPYLSTGARDLIRSMLTTDPRQRITIAQVARHPWLRQFAPPPKIPTFARVTVVPNPVEHTLSEMIGFGFTDVDATRLAIRTDPDDPATAVYHLLIAKEQRSENFESNQHHSYLLPTPPPTPAKSIQVSKRIGNMKSSPLSGEESSLPDNNWVNIPSDLALSVVVVPPPVPLKIPSINPSSGTGTSGGVVMGQRMMPLESSTLSSIPKPPSSIGGGGDPTLSLFPSPGSIVSQAAATVANHFKKLRGINILPDYRPINNNGGGSDVINSTMINHPGNGKNVESSKTGRDLLHI